MKLKFAFLNISIFEDGSLFSLFLETKALMLRLATGIFIVGAWGIDAWGRNCIEGFGKSIFAWGFATPTDESKD